MNADNVTNMLQESAENLTGKILTQIEAAIPVEKQCNAVKYIVKKIIYDSFNNVMLRVQESTLEENK